MELELGLSLSTHNPVTGSNLNKNGFHSEQLLGFNPWSSNLQKKRSFEDAFPDITKFKDSSQTLLLWSGQPNDDDHRRKKNPFSCALHLNDEVVMEEEVGVVGWPPIKSWRKKLLHHHQQQGGHIVKNRMAAGGARHSNYRSNYRFVKVKMEGVAIARKIDLRLFQSYQSLREFLISMFPKCTGQQSEEDTAEYTLTYQDKNGDWLLAEDVPWQTFMESAQRLELQRSGY